MERKLELRDISGYLPNGLAIIMKDETVNIVYGAVLNKTGYGLWNPADFYYTRYYNGQISEHFYTQYYKPILHPISDLYRTITHDGKEIIPIAELAKIAIEESENVEWCVSDGGAAYYNESEEDEDELCFCSVGIRYDEYQNAFVYFNEDSDDRCVPNQYQLFDKLNEWKIDYRGLIEAGLAVSVYDLEDNPYK